MIGGPVWEFKISPRRHRGKMKRDVGNVRQHEALHVFLDARDTLANLLVEARKSALSAQAGLEEHLGAPETLVANQDSAAVWHLIIHLASV